MEQTPKPTAKDIAEAVLTMESNLRALEQDRNRLLPLVSLLHHHLITELGIGRTRVCICGADWTLDEKCENWCPVFIAREMLYPAGEG